ncbi:MAG: OmpA family protein [Polyangiales bacterium]
MVWFAPTEEKATPPPALGPEDAPKKTWFEVKVLDVYGKPVDGAEVLFTQGTLKERAKTNGNGVARWKEVDGGSFATARLAKPQEIRDALKERWGKGTPAESLEGEKLSILEDDLSAALTAESPTTLVLFQPLTRVRLMGMHFDTNKSFLRESAMNGIHSIVSVYQKLPHGKLLVVGHTSTSGDEDYNLELSVERAEAVKAYLKDDVAAWEAWFSETKPLQKRWGSTEVRHMIKAVSAGDDVRSFQKWSNAHRGTDLEVDGVAGPKTRKALIEAYMAIDGTTLPDGIEAVVHGCGEFFPLADEGDAGGKDDVDADEDRRVEAFCFPDDITPPVPGKKAKKKEPEYELWKKQVTSELDFSVAGGGASFVLTVVDQDDQPLAGREVRVVQDGVDVFQGKLDVHGQVKITGNDPTRPCEVFVDGLAAMTLSGGPPDGPADDAPDASEAAALGDEEAFAPTGGVLAAGPTTDGEPNDDPCGADVPDEPFLGSAIPYVIKKDDTMSSIASPFGLTGKELGEFRGDFESNLKNVEKLKSGNVDVITAGEVILIPAPEED